MPYQVCQNPGLGKSGSLLNTLFNREIGLFKFSSSGDSMSNGHYEKLVCRQMIAGRQVPNGEVVAPREIELEGKGDARNYRNEPPPPKGWVQIRIPKKTTLNIVDGMVWELEKHGRKPNKHITEKFYDVEPVIRSGLKCVGKGRLPGDLENFDTLVGRCFEGTRSSSYLITLTDVGNLRIYDLVSGRVDTLMLSEFGKEGFRYTDFSVDSVSGKLHVLATVAGQAKMIIAIRYPPWKVLEIVHVEIPLKMEIYDFLFIFINSRSVQISSWDMIINETEKSPSLFNKSDKVHQSTDNYEVSVRRLHKKPNFITQVGASNGYFGILDSVWPPLCYSRNRENMMIERIDNSDVLWQQPWSIFEELSIMPFSDGTPRVLLRRGEDYSLMNVTKDTSVSPPTFQFTFSEPFDSLNTQLEVAHSPVNRLRRGSGSEINSGKLKMEVLGFAYSNLVDLLAVCIWCDNKLQVNLYESQNLTIFTSLSILQAFDVPPWRQTNGENSSSDSDYDSSRINVDTITQFVIEFESEFLAIIIRHGSTRADLFLLRLL